MGIYGVGCHRIIFLIMAMGFLPSLKIVSVVMPYHSLKQPVEEIQLLRESPDQAGTLDSIAAMTPLAVATSRTTATTADRIHVVNRAALLSKSLTADHFLIPLSTLNASTRCKAKIALARQIAMYLCHVVFSCSLTETGRAFGRDRTTVAHACACIEDRRDEPEWENILNQLEKELLKRTERNPHRFVDDERGVVVPFRPRSATP